jgi:hypothetical protein
LKSGENSGIIIQIYSDPFREKKWDPI